MMYHHSPSWPGIVVCLAQTTYTCLRSRPSTPCLHPRKQGVDGRHKAGHDEVDSARHASSIPLALPAAIISFLLSAAPAHADLKLCNHMSYVIEAAIGIDDKAATATRGWFRIDPAACRVVVQGTLTADRILLNAPALPV